MKLNRENFKKSATIDGRAMYVYTCNDQNFYLVQGYVNGKRAIKVWSGSEDMLLDDEVGNTFDNALDAWNKLEELLEVCAPQQSSSGGFKNNPQENPNILPFLAIGDVKSNSKRDVTFFVLLDDKSQTSVYSFEVDADLMPSNLPKDKVFVVDWTSVEAPMLFKSEIIMKEYSQVVFEEEPTKLVFLFIPKSIVNQGGEKGGNTEGGDEPGDEPGGEPTPPKKKGEKGEKGKKGEPSDEPGDEEPPNEGGLPSDEEPPNEGGLPSDEEPPNEGGLPSDEEPPNEGGLPKKGGDGEPKNEDEEPKDEKGNITQKDIRVDFGDTIMRISQITGEPPSVVSRFFSKKNSGATFLQTNKFNEIKTALGLPQNLNSNQVSEIIINSK